MQTAGHSASARQTAVLRPLPVARRSHQAQAEPQPLLLLPRLLLRPVPPRGGRPREGATQGHALEQPR